jgi:hypothetical protein
LKFYFNGVEQTLTFAQTIPTSIPANNGLLTIGALELGGVYSRYFDATIDDFRIYNRPISLSEIASISSSRIRLNITDGLVAYWRLDNGNDGAPAGGATVIDSSGNGVTGTPVGSPLWTASPWISYP